MPHNGTSCTFACLLEHGILVRRFGLRAGGSNSPSRGGVTLSCPAVTKNKKAQHRRDKNMGLEKRTAILSPMETELPVQHQAVEKSHRGRHTRYTTRDQDKTLDSPLPALAQMMM